MGCASPSGSVSGSGMGSGSGMDSSSGSESGSGMGSGIMMDSGSGSGSYEPDETYPPEMASALDSQMEAMDQAEQNYLDSMYAAIPGNQVLSCDAESLQKTTIAVLDFGTALQTYIAEPGNVLTEVLADLTLVVEDFSDELKYIHGIIDDNNREAIQTFEASDKIAQAAVVADKNSAPSVSRAMSTKPPAPKRAMKTRPPAPKRAMMKTRPPAPKREMTAPTQAPKVPGTMTIAVASSLGVASRMALVLAAVLVLSAWW
jgi:hypothetical protein